MNVENQLKEIAILLPPVQLEHINKHIKLYSVEISRLYALIQSIPKIVENKSLQEPKIYLHYFTGNNDYYICEYDGDDTFLGKAKIGGFFDEAKYRKFSLSNLKSNQFINLKLN